MFDGIEGAIRCDIAEESLGTGIVSRSHPIGCFRYHEVHPTTALFSVVLQASVPVFFCRVNSLDDIH